MSLPDSKRMSCLRNLLPPSDGPHQLRQPVVTGATRVQNPWLTVKEAAERARCGVKTIYREVKVGRLRAARVGGRRELRLTREWVDEWLRKMTTPTEVAA